MGQFKAKDAVSDHTPGVEQLETILTRHFAADFQEKSGIDILGKRPETLFSEKRATRTGRSFRPSPARKGGGHLGGWARRRAWRGAHKTWNPGVPLPAPVYDDDHQIPNTSLQMALGVDGAAAGERRREKWE